MADIKDCNGKLIRISKTSITIKDENGKTCGVVCNIISLYDLQPNKQIDYYAILKEIGVKGKISIKNCIIKGSKMYVFRNVKNKLFHEKYGFFSEYEKKQVEYENALEDWLIANGIEVIECLFV